MFSRISHWFARILHWFTRFFLFLSVLVVVLLATLPFIPDYRPHKSAKQTFLDVAKELDIDESEARRSLETR
jgi:hypothetical protein